MCEGGVVDLYSFMHIYCNVDNLLLFSSQPLEDVDAVRCTWWYRRLSYVGTSLCRRDNDEIHEPSFDDFNGLGICMR